MFFYILVILRTGYIHFPMKPGDRTAGLGASALHSKITVLVVVIKWNGYLRTITYTFQRTDVEMQLSVFYVMPNLKQNHSCSLTVLV